MRTNPPNEFFQAVVDSISSSLCVIDRHGDIVYVNRSWAEFGRLNQASQSTRLKPANYLLICDRATRSGSSEGRQAAIGLRALIRDEISEFSLEYHCPSPTEQRWFILTATQFKWRSESFFVLKHKDITDRKLAELEIQRLSLTDTLTGLANRRHFDAFLEREWFAHRRDCSRIALVLADMDHFKHLNDRHGHLAGDSCLNRIGTLIRHHAQRAGDLAARYGGEELALILSHCDAASAAARAESIRKEIAALAIRNDGAPSGPYLSVSFGVCSLVPTPASRPEDLIRCADQALYAAKNSGRNRVCTAPAEPPYQLGQGAA